MTDITINTVIVTVSIPIMIIVIMTVRDYANPDGHSNIYSDFHTY